MNFCHQCQEKEIPNRQRYCSAKCMFWFHVEKRSSGCWIWHGPVNKQGHGEVLIKTPGANERFREYAHRFSYRLHFGDPPRGDGKRATCIGHSCHNKTCVNPEHLVLGKRPHRPDKRRPRSDRKLTNKTVREIRRLYQKGVKGRGMCALAKQFGCSHGAIEGIVTGRTYKDV